MFQEDDLDVPPPPQPHEVPRTRGRGRGKVAAAPADEKGAAQPEPQQGKGKGRGRGGGGRTAARTSVLPCLCCPEARANQSKFCKMHKRSYDAMAYQAKKVEKEGEEGAVDAFKSAMENDYTASVEISNFARENLPEQMYVKKKFIDWARFKTMYGRSVTDTDRTKAKPMWKGEFIKWATGVKALSDAEAEEWWDEYERNPAIQRDQNGYKGRLQLWIPNMKSKLLDESSFVASQQEQGNQPIKNPDSEKIQMLRDHVKRQKLDGCHDFIQQQDKKRAIEEDEFPAEGQPKKKEKKIDLQPEAPKLSKTMAKDLLNLKKIFEAARMKLTAVFKALDEANTNLILPDQAFFGLFRTFDLRLHFLARWTSLDKTPKSAHEVLQLRYETQKGKGEITVAEDLTMINKGLEEFRQYQSASCQDILKDCVAKLPLKDAKFECEAALSMKEGKVLTIATPEEYEQEKAEWVAVTSNCSAMAVSLTKVGSDVMEHLNTKVREAPCHS